jgi:hypothetical protein
MIVTPGDAVRQREFEEWKRMRDGAAAAEQQRLDRIARWAKALSELPADELVGLAQRWQSLSESIPPAAQAALEIQNEKER